MWVATEQILDRSAFAYYTPPFKMANTSHSQIIAAPDSSGRLLRLVSASSVMMQLLGKSTNIRMSQILEHHEDEDFSAHRTKIVCTMGPSCWDVDKLVQLIDAGMNVCRLNFSHGDHEAHGRVVKNLEEALKQRPGKRVALLLDTKGPEIRTGVLEVSHCFSEAKSILILIVVFFLPWNCLGAG